MKFPFSKHLLRRLFYLSCSVFLIYALGRTYYHFTGGFTIQNITSNFSFQPQWEIRPLTDPENTELKFALDQSYRYLAKGCQSYVFLSDDDKYILKFFKYQRYRLQPWLEYAPPLPAVIQYKKEKIEKKWNKLNSFVTSWKVAFDSLKNETGLVYVHLNKTDTLKNELLIKDKLGFHHLVNLDNMEFCIQYKAEMLCDYLMNLKKSDNLAESKLLIDSLLDLILSEYRKGIGDNDHALMQNTGVVNGKPIHIDVGQFVHNDLFKNPDYAHQELFTKTYKFKIWLKEHYEELAIYLDQRLEMIIGSKYSILKPNLRIRGYQRTLIQKQNQ